MALTVASGAEFGGSLSNRSRWWMCFGEKRGGKPIRYSALTGYAVDKSERNVINNVSVQSSQFDRVSDHLAAGTYLP